MGRRTLLLIASILVAALGTALIWLYVQGADTRAEATTTQVQVLVASEGAKAGEPATKVKPQPKLVPQSLVDGLAGSLVTDQAEVAGFARTDIVAGLPLLKTQFNVKAPAAAPAVSGLPADHVAMQVTLPDPQRLVGLLQPGSEIRVYGAFEAQNSAKTKFAAVLFNKVTVLLAGPAAPDSTAATGGATNGATTVPQAIVTLALTNDQAKTLVFAQSSAGGSAALYFGLLGSAVKDDDGKAVTSGVKP